MSSNHKDARWLLATMVAEKVGLGSINEMEYPDTEALLFAMNDLLAYASPEKLIELAAEWNA